MPIKLHLPGQPVWRLDIGMTKAAVRKLSRKQSQTSIPFNKDIERLKAIIRSMLDRLEDELQKSPPLSETEINKRQKLHEWFFGSKHSLVSTLVALSDLMLKLEQSIDMDIATDSAKEMTEPCSLNAADTLLVQAFLSRMQSPQSPAQ